MNKFRIANLVAISILPLFFAQANWKTDVEKEMSLGNFNNAEVIINGLSHDIQVKDKYEIDSIRAVIKRIRYDFSIEPWDGIKEIINIRPGTTTNEISDWINSNYIEVMTIDGSEKWFRKTLRNLWLLNPTLQTNTASKNIQMYRELINSASKMTKDKNQCGNWHRARVKYELDVDADAVPAGKEVRVWLPIPHESQRQKNIKVISSSHEYIKSTGSPHSTLSLCAIAQQGIPTHFEVIMEYDVAAQTFTEDYLLNNIKPYNKESELYKQYTQTDNRHIVVNDKMRNLAIKIIGSEENPVLQASQIYNWIVNKFPWAGARDYGTIENIPEYVLNQGHGDCGQVALLYISLLRSIGIPARWESGWMLHPWNLGWHDWAETYFEGIGWVPTDVSLGRNNDDKIKSYYKTGTDIYRFATNIDYGKPLSPKKKYFRTEPIDFQAGEVEWENGNIEATQFDSNLTVLEFKPIK
ncbi:MAG: transglutaminase domain-containing protein [Muribaculaceae bacterium]|nr:transglutaminase domain-containing protein [Muribaculaceae bacterium]